MSKPSTVACVKTVAALTLEDREMIHRLYVDEKKPIKSVVFLSRIRREVVSEYLKLHNLTRTARENSQSSPFRQYGDASIARTRARQRGF